MYKAETSDKDLHEIVEQRITSLIREMEDADWPTDKIVLAIDAVIKSRWMDRLESLRDARAAMPTNFVSDGNEG